MSAHTGRKDITLTLYMGKLWGNRGPDLGYDFSKLFLFLKIYCDLFNFMCIAVKLSDPLEQEL